MKKSVKKIRSDRTISLGSGNVFGDLGFSDSEAADLQVKAELTRQIHYRIRALGLTQINAAARLHVSQPDVSKLMNGRFTGYSIERLIALLNALEMDVDIVLRPRGRNGVHRPGVVRILESAAVA